MSWEERWECGEREGVVEMGAEGVRSEGREGGEEEKGSRAWLEPKPSQRWSGWQWERLKREPPGKCRKP